MYTALESGLAACILQLGATGMASWILLALIVYLSVSLGMALLSYRFARGAKGYLGLVPTAFLLWPVALVCVVGVGLLIVSFGCFCLVLGQYPAMD